MKKRVSLQPQGHLVKAILSQTAFITELERLAAESGRKMDDLRAQAARDLAEMHSSRNPLAVRLFAALSRFVYRRGYHKQLVFDLDEVESVRTESRQRSVVFLVTHKTYLDFFVLFDFLHRQGISPPYIFGGLNMNFAGFGYLARRAGGIFIRRSFRDNAVYKAVLKCYIGHLIKQGSSFMWAIEGTRSRTGKLVRPRLGLLNYVSGASEALGPDAISYIPVSVAYDQIPDVVDMAAQEAGAEKKPENLPWFMDYVRGLGGPFGYIHIRFGDPMSFSETPDAPDFRSAREAAARHEIGIQKLAFEVCYRINEITPATMTSLVMMVLLCRGPCNDDGIRRDVMALNQYIRNRQKRVISKRSSRELSEDPVEAIESLIETGVLETSGTGPDRILNIAPDRVSVAIYYSNMAVHHFVISAFTELALVTCLRTTTACDWENLWGECQRLRNLFKFEFFFSRNEVFQDQLQQELYALDPDWPKDLEQGHATAAALLRRKPLLVAAGVLSPFVAAYRVVAEMLVRDSASRELPDGAFIASCLEAARGKDIRSGVQSLPGVSRALLANGLRVADNRGLRNSDDPDAEMKRAAFLEELELTADALSTLADLRRTPLY